MTQQKTKSEFQARPLHPESGPEGDSWAFVVLPPEVSDGLPRRGRTSVSVAMNEYKFEALLEPDGQKGHWLRIGNEQLQAAGAQIGCEAQFRITPLDQELEPEVPHDFHQALQARPESRVTWEATTTIARIDWIHWITSAKQEKTRVKRINDACEMLASGKKRVCCFDPSGFYSKAFSAPQVEK